MRRLVEQLARYNEAGRLRRAAMRLSREVPAARLREVGRRAGLGVEGRIAEDVVRLVEDCEPVWGLLAEKDLPVDITPAELDDIGGHLLGRPEQARAARAALGVSIRFPVDEGSLHVAAVRAVIPGLSPRQRVESYRYATLSPTGSAAVEPFVVALRRRRGGRGPERNEVVAALLVDPDFLRHEQDFAMVSAAHVVALEEVVRRDLEQVALTRQALARA